MPPKVAPALALRLERLTGEEASCCVPDYREDAAQIRDSPAFARTLLRAKALSDEKRLLALSLIKRRGAMCACELQAALDLTHATISHHMRALAEAGLVTIEKRGKWAYYDLTRDAKERTP